MPLKKTKRPEQIGAPFSVRVSVLQYCKEKSSRRRGTAGAPLTVRPLAIGEKKLQPRNESRAFLPAVDHAGKAAETALERPNVNALVGLPVLFRQNARAVQAHIMGGRDFVGANAHAEQGYGHFKRGAILGPA